MIYIDSSNTSKMFDLSKHFGQSFQNSFKILTFYMVVMVQTTRIANGFKQAISFKDLHFQKNRL